MNGGKNVDWVGLTVSQPLTVAQLSRDDLRVIVYEKNKSRNDVELGRGAVTARSALSSSGNWVNIRGDLFTGKISLGQFLIHARFIPEETPNQLYDGDQSIPVALTASAKHISGEPSEQAEELKKLVKMMSTQASMVESKVGGMEGTMQKQLQEVFEADFLVLHS
jgi:hypothetical protein